MVKKYITLLFVLFSGVLQAQISIKEALKKSNPVDAKSTLAPEQKIKIHTDYLQKAITLKNDTFQFYGYLYLFNDYYKVQDFVNMNRYLLLAERKANESRTASWKGAVSLRRGLASDQDEDYERSVSYYRAALGHFIEANDSIGIAESMEQVGCTYKELEKYQEAHIWYAKAIPLIKRICDSSEIALMYNNYSLLLSYEGNISGSIAYLDSAIQVVHLRNDTYKEMMYLNNKASLYSESGQISKALEIYQQCLAINLQNKWADRLQNNYLGISVAYEAQGDYHNAFDYLKKFYLLKDSLYGEEVQTKIVELEHSNELLNKQILLDKNQLELSKSKQRLTWYSWVLLSICAVGLLMIYLWRKQVKQKKKEQQESEQNHQNILQILLSKNSEILELEAQLHQYESAAEPQTETKSNIDFDIYNQRILTDADWASFKNYFEKAYPNYIQRLRDTHSDLTEAEERLFLFMKLNIKIKEAATILGISAESVKKTKTRLRKRLSLAEEVNLQKYITDF
jgi:tetratricopeptide (TPR) repeat protein